MDERPFSATFEADSSTLKVVGAIDEVSGQTFRDALQKVSAEYTRDVVVDLSEVDFMPSLAVGVLATALKAAREHGTTLDLLALEGTIAQRVLAVCALPYRAS
jgi:anti-anti-sigma factor